MWNVIRKFWDKVIEAEHAVEEVAAHEVDVIAHAAEDAIHAADVAAHAVEKVAIKSAVGITAMARNFLRLEAAGGILLVMAAIVALIIANTPLYGFYDHILNGLKFRIGFNDTAGDFDMEIRKSILLWINDGFMAIFFFLVGLEIKREVVEGELSSRTRALLPFLAAIGGMVVPAALFWFFNQDNPATLHGWAIPAATDIAFALGVLSLLGSRVPVALKILLTAIAVIDDIGAILIIALFYSHDIFVVPLYFAGASIAILAVLNFKSVCNIIPYLVIGIILWVAVLESGIHATLAGVMTALFIPVRNPKDPKHSPCLDIEHALHPWVAYGILPLFALANAGVPFHNIGLHSFQEPLTLGIIAGLVLGKPLGIFTVLFLAIKTGISPKPDGVNWTQIFALSILCGIGFTMSLFIGGLAFHDIEYQAALRLGVLSASVMAALAGFLLLLLFSPAAAKNPTQTPEK